VSFAARLDQELADRGVPRRERSRIRLEYEDHAACEPAAEARLGDPAALARDFADELAADRARGSAWLALGALAMTAVALVAVQLLGAVSQGPDSHPIWVLWLPGLAGLLVGPQAALVAGAVAALGAWRRRGAQVLPAASVALGGRRALAAIGGGLVTTFGLVLYASSFAGSEPAWWVAVVAGTAAVATGALSGAAWRVRRTTAVAVSVGGPAGDVFDDLALAAIGPAGVRLSGALRDTHASSALPSAPASRSSSSSVPAMPSPRSPRGSSEAPSRTSRRRRGSCCSVVASACGARAVQPRGPRARGGGPKLSPRPSIPSPDTSCRTRRRPTRLTELAPARGAEKPSQRPPREKGAARAPEISGPAAGRAGSRWIGLGAVMT
jgi:hypothetical protein